VCHVFSPLSVTVVVPSLLAFDNARLREVVLYGSFFRLGFFQDLFFPIDSWIMSLG